MVEVEAVVAGAVVVVVASVVVGASVVGAEVLALELEAIVGAVVLGSVVDVVEAAAGSVEVDEGAVEEEGPAVDVGAAVGAVLEVAPGVRVDSVLVDSLLLGTACSGEVTVAVAAAATGSSIPIVGCEEAPGVAAPKRFRASASGLSFSGASG